MDSPTFEALKRIMELIEPRTGAPAELREDWHRVAAWMQEAARDIDDLETLGTDDPRRELREVQ
jgi:hypothetical protein